MKKIFRYVLPLCMALLLSSCGAVPDEPAQTSALPEPVIEPVTELSSDTEAPPEETETSPSAEQTEEIPDISQLSSTEDILACLSDEEKIGQLLLGRFPGAAEAADTAEKYMVGGFTLYASDFRNETPESIPAMIGKIQSRLFVPAFMAVDEEGGTVVRVSKFPQFRQSPFASQITLARGGEELVRSETEEKAKLLYSLGLNLNLAPVADVAEDHLSYMHDRTFGENAERTADYVAAVVEVMNENNMGSCLKHFPGYGTNPDTHDEIVTDSRKAQEFEENDFIPFIKGIEAGAPSVMVCHNIVKAYDSELPASLSPEVHRVLREQLGFEGVIISDDMGMGAILQFSGDESPYVLAVLAGNDLICTSDIETAFNDISAAVADGRIEKTRLNESVRRILEMKKSLGIILIMSDE